MAGGLVITVKSQQQALIKLANRLAAVNPTDSLTCRDAAAELRVHMAEVNRLRDALQVTNDCLAKLVNGGGEDECGDAIPEVWEAARQCVLATRTVLQN